MLLCAVKSLVNENAAISVTLSSNMWRYHASLYCSIVAIPQTGDFSTKVSKGILFAHCLVHVCYASFMQSVENCVCILHNLTYQLETEAPEQFTKYTEPEVRANAKKSAPVGCFSPKSKKITEVTQ